LNKHSPPPDPLSIEELRKIYGILIEGELERWDRVLNMNEVLKNVRQWAVEVGKYQLSMLEKKLEYHSKSTVTDIVTEIDYESERMLISRIQECYPEHSILSEEEGMLNEGNDYMWIIDPLDGTNNYFHGYPIFSVSIALYYKGEAMLGAVYVPKLDELFYGSRGEGAYLNGRRIQVSDREDLQTALMATGFPYDKAVDCENNNLAILNSLLTQIMCIRRSGSAAFDLCCVASGRLDGFWELKLKLWDIAAGRLLIEEAGGKVITSVKEKGINIIAGNNAIVERLCCEINGCYDKF
ncbi:MAG: inositol monophosphatase family protein, partial [Bacillota bacterium]